MPGQSSSPATSARLEGSGHPRRSAGQNLTNPTGQTPSPCGVEGGQHVHRRCFRQRPHPGRPASSGRPLALGRAQNGDTRQRSRAHHHPPRAKLGQPRSGGTTREPGASRRSRTGKVAPLRRLIRGAHRCLADPPHGVQAGRAVRPPPAPRAPQQIRGTHHRLRGYRTPCFAADVGQAAARRPGVMGYWIAEPAQVA